MILAGEHVDDEDTDDGVCMLDEDVDTEVCIVRIDVVGGGPTRVGCPFVEDSPVGEDDRAADDDPVLEDLVDDGVHNPVDEDVHLPTRIAVGFGAKD